MLKAVTQDFFLTSWYFQVSEHWREIGGGNRTREGWHGVRLQCLSQHQRYSGKCARSSGGSADCHASAWLRILDHVSTDQVLSTRWSKSLRVGRQITLHRARLFQRGGTSGHSWPRDLQKTRHRILTNRSASRYRSSSDNEKPNSHTTIDASRMRSTRCPMALRF